MCAVLDSRRDAGMKRLPPFGKELAERMRFSNPPLYAVVAIGLDAWQRAKDWNASKADTVAMVLPADAAPAALAWPVEGVPVVIYTDAGPSTDQIHALAKALLQCGAASVLQIDLPTPTETFDRYTEYRWSAS